MINTQCNSKNNWQIFSNLDVDDEAEQLELSNVFRTLLDTVPDMYKQEIIKEYLQNDSEDTEINSDSTVAFDVLKISTFNNFSDLRCENINGIKSYILPRGPMSIDTAEKIVEIYRTGGQLHPKSVRKILRDSYKYLRTLPNVIWAELPHNTELTVVGDLHGQLHDLFYILDESGMPSERNLYLFNGDFVDRGTCGVEVTMIIFAFMLALPNHIFLNRGNHEEFSITCIYGFEKEVKKKYDEVHFSMFIEVFRYLPIATVFNNKVLTIHGGLFENCNIFLQDLMTIPRTEYIPKALPGAVFSTQQEIDFEDKMQLMRGALWSDPWDKPGIGENARGAGVMFGPDVAKTFLQKNHLELMVRSHECVKPGFHQPFSGNEKHLLCTIFSASNYGNSGNKGAYLKFSYERSDDCYYVSESKDLFYTVHTFSTVETINSLEFTNQNNLINLIIKRKRVLKEMFDSIDKDEDGCISIEEWTNVMQNATGLQIRWQMLQTILIDPQCLYEDNRIEPNGFLIGFRDFMKLKTWNQESEVMLDILYTKRNTLLTIFNFFDTNHDGIISREEFRNGCELINMHVLNHHQIHNSDKILDIIDFDSNGGIDMNEFLEAFRLTDEFDGGIKLA